ncbi:DUF4365 domain-containing protein [uncultured Methanolobus sp.]|uniref:DUF4365 domain-containing protein n=1 Tax=uncultured Methanolobus sp. TaxID=218300 RepID=UPI002AAAF2DF|nr:DUF4365 domain-containing protein [uncultured Methanolobus sp.]
MTKIIKADPAPYPKSNIPENKAISIFEHIIHENVKTDIRKNDKVPNTDGILEITNDNQIPLGRIDVQIKKLSDNNLKIPKHQCNLKYLAYCERSILPTLLILVDTTNDVAYWLSIDKNLLKYLAPLIKDGAKSLTVSIPTENIIKKKNKDYLEKWIEIINKHKEKLDNYDFLEKENLHLKSSYTVLADENNLIFGKTKSNFEAIHNPEIASKVCLKAFLDSFKMNHDMEESLQIALDTAKEANKNLELSINQYNTLKGQIIFYAKKHDLFELKLDDKLGDKPADFYSPNTNRYFDILTNPDYADIEDYLRCDSKEYKIAYVDTKSEEIEIIPTVFPTCPKCGGCLHSIFFLDNQYDNEIDIGFSYTQQDLVSLCIECGTSKIVDTVNYYINGPDFYPEYDFRYQDPNGFKEFSQKIWTRIGNFARKEFNVFISAVTCLEEEMWLAKDDFITVENPKWIHPILQLNSQNINKTIYFPTDNIYRE